MFLFQRCLSFGESNKGSKQRQGPTLSVHFTELSVVHIAKGTPVSTVHAKGTLMAIIKCGTKHMEQGGMTIPGRTHVWLKCLNRKQRFHHFFSAKW